MARCKSADVAPPADAYKTAGGAQAKPTYGLSLGYLTGKAGETGFGSKTTAAEVASSWDGRGCVAIVTGASTGLGYESCRVLASRGCHVVATVRTQERADATAARLRGEVPGAQVSGMALDLASLTSVRAFAAAFAARGLGLNILLLNAGVMACPLGHTAEGWELQWGTNHLGHFLLTQLLLDNMTATARASGREGRIVVVSSVGHQLFEVEGGINFDALRPAGRYDAWKAYGVSKLSNILFARELNERLTAADQPVVAVSLHPGFIFETDLSRHMAGGALMSRITSALARPLLKTCATGTSTQVLLATAPRVAGGEYYVDCNVAPSSWAAHDRALGRKLWAFSEAAVA